MKSQHQQRINEFMKLAGQAIPPSPCTPSAEVRRLRATLILEEALETVEALGFAAVVDTRPDITFEVDRSRVRMVEVGPSNLVEIADGCADISVVTIGTLSACGISDEMLLLEVDQSNLRKFDGGGYRRDDGKWMKPSDWQPPNIADVLAQQSIDAVDYPEIA